MEGCECEVVPSVFTPYENRSAYNARKKHLSLREIIYRFNNAIHILYVKLLSNCIQVLLLKTIFSILTLKYLCSVHRTRYFSDYKHYLLLSDTI